MNYTKWIFGWIDISKNFKDFVLFCRFENLITNPKDEFKKILDFYEINLNEKLIDKIVQETQGKKDMVKNIEESKILPWALSSNFRSGKIGNWKKEFDNSNIKNFKELVGDALIKLDYERDLNW